MSGRNKYTMLSCSKRCPICRCHDYQKWVRSWSSDTLRFADIDTESVWRDYIHLCCKARTGKLYWHKYSRNWNLNKKQKFNTYVLSISVEKKNRNKKTICCKVILSTEKNEQKQNEYAARGLDPLTRAFSVIYLVDTWIFKCVKWDRDVLDYSCFCGQRSVLVGVRRISKGDV